MFFDRAVSKTKWFKVTYEIEGQHYYKHEKINFERIPARQYGTKLWAIISSNYFQNGNEKIRGKVDYPRS